MWIRQTWFKASLRQNWAFVVWCVGWYGIVQNAGGVKKDKASNPSAILNPTLETLVIAEILFLLV